MKEVGVKPTTEAQTKNSIKKETRELIYKLMNQRRKPYTGIQCDKRDCA